MQSLRISAILLAGLLLAAAAAAQDQPTIQKDSVLVKLKSWDETMRNGERREGSGPAWVPGLEFRVNGPIAGGSQLYVLFSLPTDKHWMQFDCPTHETEAGKVWESSCGYGFSFDYEKLEAKNVSVTGPVEFFIKMRNELQGSDVTLFTGKINVIKERPIPQNPKHWEFFADEDWRIPIGYVFFSSSDRGHGGDTFLHVGFWYRGNPAELEAHLFYNGKDIATFRHAGNGPDEWKPNNFQWGYADCEFLGVYPNAPEDGGYNPNFSLTKNPGDYEVKVLIVNHLARSIKFTVNADGSFDNGIATANHLGSDKVIVPVQVIGNQTTNWNRSEWKTGAFYGNPLTGFTAIP